MKIKFLLAASFLVTALIQGNFVLAGAVAPIVNNSGTTISVTVNAGDVMDNPSGNAIDNSGTISSLINNGSITSGNTASIQTGNIGTLINNNLISGSDGISVANSTTINTLTNNAGATISGGYTGSAGIFISAAGSIDTINNYGVINGNYGGILNWGNIGTLNNAQNGLVYVNWLSNMPSRYNIIVNSPSSYGSIDFQSINGSTTFGVSPLSTLTTRTYTQVLLGIGALNITNRTSNNTVSGTLGTYRWTLQLDPTVISADVWDLVVTSLTPPGPSAADTQASLQNTATALKSTYALQNSVIANSLNYDCQVFDKNNVCVSAGGRNTNVQAGGVNNVSALLIAAYRAMPEVRVGAYLDQNLSVTSSSSPVVLGNGGPLFGVFGVWNQNPEGTETEVKVSASFGQKNTTTTRAVVGTSEAGVGSATLNNSGVQAIAKYGFAVTRDAMVSPYIGLRYSQGNMGGYTEATSATVTTPLTYAALNTNATTFMAGVHGKYKLTPEAVVQASVGLESDTNVNNGSLTATGITGLTAINFNPNPVKTRPVAMLGGYYDVAKAQRVALTGIYRQEPYQAIGSTTVLATYTVGF